MATRETNQPKGLSATIIVLGIAVMLLLAVVPLLTIEGTEFGGSDGLGAETVKHINPDYDETWTANIWEPPGGETESMLFALQAAVGGILIGYFFGYKRGQKVASDQVESKRLRPE
jgi:cobalt/nickel transport protein